MGDLGRCILSFNFGAQELYISGLKCAWEILFGILFLLKAKTKIINIVTIE